MIMVIDTEQVQNNVKMLMCDKRRTLRLFIDRGINKWSIPCEGHFKIIYFYYFLLPVRLSVLFHDIDV